MNTVSSVTSPLTCQTNRNHTPCCHGPTPSVDRGCGEGGSPPTNGSVHSEGGPGQGCPHDEMGNGGPAPLRRITYRPHRLSPEWPTKQPRREKGTHNNRLQRDPLAFCRQSGKDSKPSLL
ncbi:hypothetical protein AAFF_G00034510 [Aldrovandia affinis]|uniref:Uncharacterized protein n=1 Tax=Aldrovandia affinis TaxID=143900 RepID=A0AAD7WGM1_9TELE|nr:hypothetical protein AAFF_G00034510 [Aldrovandia affinis]